MTTTTIGHSHELNASGSAFFPDEMHPLVETLGCICAAAISKFSIHKVPDLLLYTVGWDVDDDDGDKIHAGQGIEIGLVCIRYERLVLR